MGVHLSVQVQKIDTCSGSEVFCMYVYTFGHNRHIDDLHYLLPVKPNDLIIHLCYF